jgi:murein DD-endopeptidase MepM/ murein hydrolase activator NlpD
MKRFLGSLLVLALVAVLVNDGGRYLRSYSDLNLKTNDLASWASVNGRDLSAQQGFAKLAEKAKPDGIAIVRYDCDGQRLHVWTEKQVTGTWIAGTVIAMHGGVPFATARNTPIAIYRNVEATFQ